MSEDSIHIDGNYGEGGGSIVRFSMAFAALLKQSLEIDKIRFNRRNPGLRTQHMLGIKLIKQIFGGDLEGAELGSTKIIYKPNRNFILNSDSFSVPISTAASIGLIIQTLQIGMANLQKNLIIYLQGGATYGLWAPSIDYIVNVTLKYLQFFGYDFELNVQKHGFYPKGGAEVYLKLRPSNSINDSILISKRDSITHIKGISIASEQLKKANVAERTAKAAKSVLEKNGFSTEIDHKYVNSNSIGSGITIWTESKFPFGSSEVGRRGISAENVGQTVATNFLQDWSNGGVLDEYMTDQIIPFMALHPSEITTGPLSLHSKTNLWLCNQFLPKTKFDVLNIDNNLFSIKSKV